MRGFFTSTEMYVIDFDYILPSGANAKKTVREVFFSNISGEPDDCWNWTGKRFTNGYGSFGYKGKCLLAHRVAYELFNRTPPSGVVMHSCDNRGCVNPEHLKLGSTQDNILDKVQKGRSSTAKGLKHPRAKLSYQAVADIVRRRAAGEFVTTLAAEYGVSPKQVSVVSRGLQRSYVTEELGMMPSEYVEKAMRTNNDMGRDKNIIHAAMLLVSEAGEVASEVKRMFAYGAELDRLNVIEEMGDILWGIALMCTQLDVTLEEVMATNIRKLSKRYPGLGFSAEQALNRDPVAEKEAIKG